MEYHRKRRAKILFLMIGGAIGIMLLVIGGYQLVEFSDSTGFCGRLCHSVMYPEYTTYQASPHSRVLCSHCHVGSGADYLVRSKISGIPLIFVTLTGKYDRPIPTPVENLRPARETCEQCHWPGRFAGDLVRVHTTYATDEQNTQKSDTRVLRVGGGDSGTARDIHWHITANVWYLPMDDKRQNIAWVGVEQPDGSLKEFVDPGQIAQVTPEALADGKRLMDCIDCHNRATHVFRSPDELIDTALTQGKIDITLPYIKREGLQALDPMNPSLEEAYTKVYAIKGFYQANYPQVAADKATAIDAAISQLMEIARLTTFPDMKVSWDTYIDNISHTESPGCFRCHGKLVETSSSPNAGTIIDGACDSCHYFDINRVLSDKK